jgi:hypothetical protein
MPSASNNSDASLQQSGNAVRTQEGVSRAYESGLWVPTTYGNRFSVANKNGGSVVSVPGNPHSDYSKPYEFTSEIDSAFRADTLEEACTECDSRNQARGEN